MAISNAGKQAQDKPSLRMSGEDRRQQIIDVAIRLFSQKGFRGTTTKEIALAAGVNEAIIFRHFATKQELYTAIIDQKADGDEFQTLEAEVEQAMKERDDRRLFEAIAYHIFEFHRRDDSLMRLLFYSALEGHELADIFYRKKISVHHRRTADYIKRRIAEGAFRKTDPHVAARAFIGMVIYHSQMEMLYERDKDEKLLNFSSRQAAERFTDLFLSSLLNHNYLQRKPTLRRAVKK